MAKNNENSLGNFVWNSRTKELFGRSGSSWAKISLFYSIFYLFLASFFFGMLGVFVNYFMPLDRPTYYGEESIMNQQGFGLGYGFRLNPGLGFRPQIDPEDELINYDPSKYESTSGFRKFFVNLKNYLDSKYKLDDKTNVINCEDGKNYSEEFEQGKSCEFNYKQLFAGTGCTEENHYGYKSNRPCVLLKLNKIYSWVPEFEKKENTKIELKCEGEQAVDKDNIKRILYHSENNVNQTAAGYIDSKFYPFRSQASYRQPFVFLEFDVTPDVLIRVICRAYAANIDNEDRRNKRGMTTFDLYVGNTKA